MGKNPLAAVKVIGYTPSEPAAGVPLSTPLELRVTPAGRVPDSVNTEGGLPEAVTVKLESPPSVTNVVLVALVNAGAVP